jgi:hypothetical protein
MRIALQHAGPRLEPQRQLAGDAGNTPIAAAHGDAGQASVKFFGRLVRESLKILAVVFGYAMAAR